LLERRLAVGGSAEVYLARPRRGTHPAPRFVIKRILNRSDRDDAFQMLLHEAELNQAVRHPNVVEVFGAGQVEGEPYLAMEYVAGVDLFRLLRRLEAESRPLSAEMCVHLTCRIASALEAVHSAQDAAGHFLEIVHRDVTPSNVYLSTQGDVKLGDFGIARMSTPRLRPVQQTAGLKGKFGYLSPEQIAGEPFDCRADLFSLAVVFGEMLIGERIFPGSGQLAVLLAIRDGNIEPLRRAETRLPAALYSICLKGLMRDPGARFQTAAEFRQALLPYEIPNASTLHDELGGLVRWASDSKQLAQRLKGQIRDSVDRMRAVRLAQSSSNWAKVVEADQSASNAVESEQRATKVVESEHGASNAVESEQGATKVVESEQGATKVVESEQGATKVVESEQGATKVVEPTKTAFSTLVPAETLPSAIPPYIENIDEGTSIIPTEALTRGERVTASIRFKSGKTLESVGFPRLVEMVATGELCGDDEVSLMGEALCPLREIPALSKYLMPSTTATTLRVSPVGIPDYQVTLSDTPLLEILAKLRANADTGALFVERKEGDGVQKRKEIYVRDGRLLHVASSERDELLGEYLIRRGALERHELEFALDIIATRGGRLGDTLVSLCIVDAVDIFRAIRDLGRDRVAALCSWTRGQVSFYRGTVPHHVEFPLDLDLASPMMAGVLVASPGLSGFELPQPHRIVFSGPRAPTMGSRRERGTVPIALLLVQQLATRGFTVAGCIEELTAVRMPKGARNITEREAAAALVVGRVLGWIAFQ
jgi:serine/threonine protein kinase